MILRSVRKTHSFEQMRHVWMYEWVSFIQMRHVWVSVTHSCVCVRLIHSCVYAYDSFIPASNVTRSFLSRMYERDSFIHVYASDSFILHTRVCNKTHSFMCMRKTHSFIMNEASNVWTRLIHTCLICSLTSIWMSAWIGTHIYMNECMNKTHSYMNGTHSYMPHLPIYICMNESYRTQRLKEQKQLQKRDVPGNERCVWMGDTTRTGEGNRSSWRSATFQAVGVV